MRLLIKRIVLFLLPIGCATGVLATEAENGGVQRPRIGLVLSGGGARGAAHVGVIRVLEENRIPIDVIAGTSMGAIVGGLYASGMSVDEIDHTIRTIDWDDALSDKSKRQLKPYRRKLDDEDFLFDAAPGYRDGKVVFPPGLIIGQKIGLIFKELTLPVATVSNFDDLAIPFRAVATNIVDGGKVVLGEGDLAKAMRASMAVPGVFAPIEHQGMLLVDGGLSDNLPVKVARDMGADVVIVVDISTPLGNREDLTDVFAITVQLTGLLTRTNTERSIASLTARDILILPDLESITSMDFDKADEAIPRGREAALKHLDRLRDLSVGAVEYASYRADSARAPFEQPIIEFVRIDNQTRYRDQYLENVFHVDIGSPLDVQALEHDIAKIYAYERFEKVYYDVLDEDGQTGLEIHVIEKSWGPNYLQGGMGLAADFSGSNSFTLAGSYTKTALNDRGAEWRTILQFGEEREFSTELYQPLDDNLRYFVNPQILYRGFNLNQFSDDNKIAEYRIRGVSLRIDAGRELGTWGELRTGFDWTVGDAELRVGDPALPDGNFKNGRGFVRLSYDTLDHRYFPKQGFFGRLEGSVYSRGLGGDEDYSQAELSLFKAQSWGRDTFVIGGTLRTTLDDDAPIQSLYRLGGFLELSGLERRQLTGQHSARLAAIYYRRIGDFQLIPMYVGISVEAGNVWQNQSDIDAADLLASGSIYLGFDTPIGPIYVGVGHTHGGRDSAFLYMGKPF